MFALAHGVCGFLCQAVHCVPVQTRAYLPSTTAPGSGETASEMRLAVDLLTPCYQGHHGERDDWLIDWLRCANVCMPAWLPASSDVHACWLLALILIRSTIFAAQSVGPVWVLLALLAVAFPAVLFVLVRRAFGPSSTPASRADRLQW
jgi:hypothetical protein